MMRMAGGQQWRYLLAGLFSILLLVACGGGGPLADGGVGGTGVVASGNVTGLGSIFVNGVEYRVAGARFDREGEAPIEFLNETQSDIRVGMQVQLDGTLDSGGLTGQAVTIDYRDLLEGQIDTVTSLDGQVKVLSILNQQVIVEDGFTRFQGVSFIGLDSFSGFLEVSGLRLNDGRIQATYLESRNPGQLEIEGVITATAANSFSIGALNVLSGPHSFVAGDLVEVKGSAFATPDLTPDTVDPVTAGLGLVSREVAEIEGFVTGIDPIASGDLFQVNGQAVRYSAATRFDGGSAADLVDGTKVEVEGALTGGELAADKISFRDEVRLEGDVASIDLGAGTLTLDGLAGIQVIVDVATTELDGTTGLSGATPLVIGDHVRIRGHETSSAGTVLASRLRLRSPSANVILRGPVEDNPVVFNQISILGISVDTSALPDPNGFFIEEDDGSETPVDRATFFSSLQTGEVVKLSGTLGAGSVTWGTAVKQNEVQ